jgi:hypothetical protein
LSKWRRLAIELFPEYNKGFWAFQHGSMSLPMIFFELLYDLDKKLRMVIQNGYEMYSIIVNGVLSNERGTMVFGMQPQLLLWNILLIVISGLN